METVAAQLMEAKEGLSTQLEAFAAATMEYMKQERTLLLDGVGVPQVQTPMAGRHVLVVARGYDYRDDLVSLRHYIKEFRPVLIGVDGGAEALVEAGYHPDVIVGDLHAVSDEILRGGAEVVVPRRPGRPRRRAGAGAGHRGRRDRLPDLGHQRGRRPAARRRARRPR